MVILSSCLIRQIISFILRIWLCIRLNFAHLAACDRLTEDADFAKKKIIFSDEAHFVLGCYVTSKIYAFGAQKTPTHTLERRTQNESLFGADFGPEA